MKRAIAAAVLAIAMPAAAQQAELVVIPGNTPVPPEGTFICALGAPLCLVNAADFWRDREELERVKADLAKLRASCVAKLEVVPKKAIPVDPKTNRPS